MVRLLALFFSVLMLSQGLLPFHEILQSVIIFYKVDNTHVDKIIRSFKIVEIIDSGNVERVFGG